MPLSECIEIVVSPELRGRLEARARQEGKSIGDLLVEFAEMGLGLPTCADRLEAVKRLAAMNLPT